MPSNVWDEIIDPFQKPNGCTADVWEWINNFITHFIMDVITNPCNISTPLEISMDAADEREIS